MTKAEQEALRQILLALFLAPPRRAGREDRPSQAGAQQTHPHIHFSSKKKDQCIKEKEP